LANEYIIRTKALAHYMMTGQSPISMLAKNAEAIAYRVGLADPTTVDVSDELIRDIDQLASLYAMRYLNKNDTDLLSSLNDKNQLDSLLVLHGKYAEQSTREFETNAFSKQKGYISPLMSAWKEVIAIDEKDQQTYENWGYTRISDLNKSKYDGSKENRILMFNPNNGQQRYLSGAIFLNSSARRGTVFADKTNQIRLSQTRDAMVKDFLAMTKKSWRSYEPVVRESEAIPTYNQSGEVVSVAYEMSNFMKEHYLDQNMNPAKLLSSLGSSLSVNDAIKQHNQQTIDQILEDYSKATEADKRTRYILVGSDAFNKRSQEYWRLLPDELKEYIKEKTGTTAFHVKKDVLNALMGYSKINLIQNFIDQAEKDNLMGRAVAHWLSTATGQKVTARAADILNIWYELINKLKDFIVIRTGAVLAGNIASNIVLALVNKLDPLRLMKDATVAWRFAKEYQEMSRELEQLKVWANTRKMTKAMRVRMTELSDAIRRNPLAEFIEAGMMPSIVNDVSVQNDPFATDSPLDSWLDEKFGKLPIAVQKAAKFFLVSKGTSAHNALLNATQLSDFVFRYAVFQQELRKGINKQQAMKLARDMFINFDLPTSRGVQLLNDLGLMMFTKFFFRIQSVIWNQIKKHPVSAALVPLALSNLGLPGIIPLLFAHRLMYGYPIMNNPLTDLLTILALPYPMQMLSAIL